MIRQATIEDASRIAEISIFTKRMNYRFIFRNDKVSFGEMQVYPLADSYIHDPQLLKGIWVLEKNTDAQRFYSKHLFVLNRPNLLIQNCHVDQIALPSAKQNEPRDDFLSIRGSF